MMTSRRYGSVAVLTVLYSCLVLSTKLVSCQITVNNLTAFHPDLPIQHATVDSESGDIYVGGTNFVYHLTSNLTLVAKRSSSTADITNFCPSGANRCRLPPEWEENENRILLIDRENDFLMACGSAFNGTCVLHQLGVVGTVVSRVHDPANYIDSSLSLGESVVAYYGETIVSSPDQSMATGLFVGANFNPKFNGSFIQQHAVSTKRLLQINGRWTFEFAYQDNRLGRYTFIDVKPEYVNSFPIKYVNGFTNGGFSYFTVVQKADIDQEVFETRVVRICNSDNGYYSYTEMPLKCQSPNKSHTYSLLQAAHVGPLGANLAQDLKKQAGELALFGIFAKSSEEAADKATGHSALCIFPLKKINQKITYGLDQCFRGYDNQGLRQFSDDTPCEYASYRNVGKDFCGTGDLHPVQAQAVLKGYDYLNGGGHGHHYTSLTSTIMGDDTVAVMGTKAGNLHKFIIEPRSFNLIERDYPLRPYKNIKLDTEGPVLRDMNFDPSEDHLYVMTPRKMYKIPMKTCEHYTHCSDCVTSSDPNQCGWCGGVCTTEAECLGRDGPSGDWPDGEVDAEDGPDWVTDACAPVIYEVSPLFGPLEGGTTVYIFGDSLSTGSMSVNTTLDVTIADQPCDVLRNASNVTQ